MTIDKTRYPNDWSHLIAFQDRVRDWMIKCFGDEITMNVRERNDRFIEEALELVQSLNYSKEDVLTLVDYVFNRPKGEPIQEVGGVMITLAAVCIANRICLDGSARIELERVRDKIEVIREKQKNKPHNSPLPGYATVTASSEVNHPAHYGGAANPYEAIKVIEAWDLDFCLGNAIKYISRWGKKQNAQNDLVQDLEKAKWYLERKIKQLKNPS